jgi:hypothetical protein
VSETEQKATRLWWQRLVELAAFIAVPPTLAYAFGVGALWVQLTTAYSFSDAWTTWHAATMATKPVTAGLGVGVLLRAFSFSLLFGGVLLLVAWPFVRKTKKRCSSNENQRFWPSLLVPLLCLSLVLYFAIFSFPGDTFPIVPNLRVIGIPVLAYLLCLYVLWVLGPEERSLINRVFAYYPRPLYSIISFIAILLVVFFMLYPGELQLPCLTREISEGDVLDGEVLTAERAEELDAEITVGRLIAHANGYWHVFDESGELTAIPNNDQARWTIEAPFGATSTDINSNYSGPYEDAPDNPINQC